MRWSITAPTVTQEEVEAERRALSDEERRQIHDDIYGSYEPIPETPHLVKDRISEMNEHIEDILDEEKEAYLAAQEKCADYCNSEDFLIMFLRADKFNAEKAAKRLVAYWEEKLDLFGPEYTFRRLSINNLLENPNDVELLEAGAIYPLPEQDNAGRGILFVNRSKLALPQFDRRSKLRVIFYMLHCLVDHDHSVQKKGFVLIVAPPENIQYNHDRKFVRRAFNRMRDSFPIWGAAHHLVVPTLSLANLLFLPAVYFLMGKYHRDRFVTHSYQQSPQETGRAFNEYGIEIQVLPVDLGGTVQFKYGAWLDQRRATEEERYKARENGEKQEEYL